VDKTNSQPKSSHASVGSDHPIEVPETNQASSGSEQYQHHSESARHARPTPAADRQASASHDDRPRRSRRYYDDSDDMIERVRRARATFEKRINAFQGPDWPFYEKRIIAGKKSTESSAGSDNASLPQTAQSQSSGPSAPAAEPEKPKE